MVNMKIRSLVLGIGDTFVLFATFVTKCPKKVLFCPFSAFFDTFLSFLVIFATLLIDFDLNPVTVSTFYTENGRKTTWIAANRNS